MSHEINEALPEVCRESPVGDVPQLDGAVFRPAGDDVVVEGVPLDVQYRPAVATNLHRYKHVHCAVLNLL